LPWSNDFFDAVVGINSFQFASDPRRALAEAARVTKPGGLVGASLFGAPERSESTAIHLALAALSPPARQSDHAPYALSAPGNLESAFADVGLDLVATGEVPLSWHYQSAADAVRGLLSSAGGTRAAEDAGVPRVRAAIEEAVKPCTDADGEIELRNVFRWVAGSRPPR
jgi:SAM-dependent methyltransferase